MTGLGPIGSGPVAAQKLYRLPHVCHRGLLGPAALAEPTLVQHISEPKRAAAGREFANVRPQP